MEYENYFHILKNIKEASLWDRYSSLSASVSSSPSQFSQKLWRFSHDLRLL